MDRKSADRIIVKTNDRMKMVLDWYIRNKKRLDEQEFHAPMDAGVIELIEERIELTFESKGNIVELAVYPMEKSNLPAAITYDYNPRTKETSNYRPAPHLPKKRREMLLALMQVDNTHLKEALKYHILMLFMIYYREIITVEEKGRRTKREAKAFRKKTDAPLPLIRKQYVIEDADEKDLRLPGEKRAYTKPEHEVNVRGFMRHYKSGKSVWIEPSVRYRGKTRNRKDYEL